MKRRLMVALAAAMTVLLAMPSFGQIEFGAGVKGGLNFGTLSFDPEQLAPGVTKSGRTGAMFGAVAELGFAKMFYVVLEPTYCGKGCTFEQGAAKQTFSVNYLNLPVLFKVKFLKGLVRPYGFVGPNIGMLLSATSKLEGVPGAGETDLKDNTSGTDFALDFGGGAELNLVPQIGITADVRYSLGLSDINKPPAAAGGTAVKIKTSGFQVLVGVMFHVL